MEIGLTFWKTLLFHSAAVICSSQFLLLSQPLKARHVAAHDPRAEWDRLIHEKAPNLPASYLCENGDVVQIMVTKVNHGQGNLLVSYMNISGHIYEGLYYTRGTYSRFRKGIHAGDFYDQDSPRLVGFDSWTDSGKRSYHFLQIAKNLSSCSLADLSKRG